MWVHVSQQFTNIPYIRGQKLFLQNVLKCLVFCICIQSLQKVLLWHKPFCPEKYQYGYHKRRILWFYADFKFVDAAFKKYSIWLYCKKFLAGIIYALLANFEYKCKKAVHFQTFWKRSKVFFSNIYHSLFDSYWNFKKSIIQ